MSEKFVFLFCFLAAIIWGAVDYTTNEYATPILFVFNWLTRLLLFIFAGLYYGRLTKAKEQRRIILEQKSGLEETKQALEKANIQLNNFIGVAAHDIRNPVGNIQMMSEMIMDDETISKESKKMLEMIHESSKIALQILSDTLNLSKIRLHLINSSPIRKIRLFN